MLSYEPLFGRHLSEKRRNEAAWVRRSMRIRACQTSLSFSITPLMSFVMFSVYRAMYPGEMEVGGGGLGPALWWGRAVWRWCLVTLHIRMMFSVQAAGIPSGSWSEKE